MSALDHRSFEFLAGFSLLTMLTLQAMLVRPVGDKIYLLPAWPRDWSARFKLHAPARTVVEGEVRNGELVDLRVTPAARRPDVVIRGR